MTKFKILETSRLSEVEMTRIVGGTFFCPPIPKYVTTCATEHSSCPRDYYSCVEGGGYTSCQNKYVGPKGPAGLF